MVPAEAAWYQVVPLCFQCRSSVGDQLVTPYIARMVDIIDTKKIMSALPPKGWKRLLRCPCITWFKTAQNDLKSHITLTEAPDMVQNRPV